MTFRLNFEPLKSFMCKLLSYFEESLVEHFPMHLFIILRGILSCNFPYHYSIRTCIFNELYKNRKHTVKFALYLTGIHCTNIASENISCNFTYLFSTRIPGPPPLSLPMIGLSGLLLSLWLKSKLKIRNMTSTFACWFVMSLINKAAYWLPYHYHKAARKFPQIFCTPCFNK